MKKLFLFLALSFAIVSCEETDEIFPDDQTSDETTDDQTSDETTDDQTSDDTATYAVLTFEDADYKGTGNYLGYSDWSSLIDEQYYGAPLIYGEADENWNYNTDYNWYDEGNTELASEFLTGWYGTNFGSGGHAISNYTLAEVTDDPYYSYQLSVVATGNGGYNGSENFAMHYGYDEYAVYESNPDLPNFYFKDGTARVVDHMYVIASNILLNFIEVGYGEVVVSDEDYIILTAAGYDATGALTGTTTIDLVRNGAGLSSWTKFDLSSLGEVITVKFNVSGTTANNYGFCAPAYFAYDNVTVKL